MSTNKVSSNQRSIVTVDEIFKHLMTFCMQPVHHAQFKSIREFICGSYIEIPDSTNLATHHGVDNYMLDMDQMFYNTGEYATYPPVPFPKP